MSKSIVFCVLVQECEVLPLCFRSRVALWDSVCPSVRSSQAGKFSVVMVRYTNNLCGVALVAYWYKTLKASGPSLPPVQPLTFYTVMMSIFASVMVS